MPEPDSVFAGEGFSGEAPAASLVEAGFTWGVADTPLPHAGLNVADVAHVLILRNCGDYPRSGAAPASAAAGCLCCPADSSPYDSSRGDPTTAVGCSSPDVHVDQFHCHQTASPDPAPASQDDFRSPGLQPAARSGEVTVAARPPPRRKCPAAVVLGPMLPGELAFAEIALGLIRRHHVDRPLPGRARVKTSPGPRR